jgi:hypothetical protein
MSKEKKEVNIPVLILSIFGLVALVLAISFVYLSLNGKNYTNLYEQKLQSGEIQNPITEFALSSSTDFSLDEEKSIVIEDSILEGLGDIDKSLIQEALIEYASVILKLYNLHTIPFTSITPKVQINIDSDFYYVEIIKGDIIIKTGQTDNEDIKITTTREEILKIANDNDYAKESISSGKTSIEMIANKVVLFSKGYLNLYKEFSTISGFFIK